MTFPIVRALWDIINSPCVGRVITRTLVTSSLAISEAGMWRLELKTPNLTFFSVSVAEKLI